MELLYYNTHSNYCINILAIFWGNGPAIPKALPDKSKTFLINVFPIPKP